MLLSTLLNAAINKSIPIEKGIPGNAAINPNTNRAYISYTSSNFIIIVDLEKGSIENKIKATSPRNIFVNSDTNKVYIGSAWGTIEIDALTNNFQLIKSSFQYSEELKYASPSSLNHRGVHFDAYANRKYIINHESNSIFVIDSRLQDKTVDIINLGRDRWGNTGHTDPSFIFFNDLSKVLYVKMHWTANAGGGGAEGESLIAIDTNTKKRRGSHSLPRSGQVGFAFNYNTNSIYMKKSSGKAILKLSPFLNVLSTTALEKLGFWHRLVEGIYEYFGEVIAVNTLTNKVYASDSSNCILYELEA